MKKQTYKISRKGVTLIELTVVIVVLLSLVSVLFIGARAWKEGSDRAACILNLRAFQQGIRSYANLNEVDIGSAVSDDAIIAAGFMGGTGGDATAVPPVVAAYDATCPLDGDAYSDNSAGNVPAVGTLWKVCQNAASDNHVPSDITTW